MAFFAIRAELPAMNIRVAVCAARPYIAENRFCVTLNAINFRVHSAKRIIGFVVVELRNRADRLPARLRMAIFAGDRQRTVRAACLRVRYAPVLSKARCLKGQQERRHENEVHQYPLEHELELGGLDSDF